MPGKRTDKGKHDEYTGILGYSVNETVSDNGSGPEISGGEFGEFGTSHRCAVDVLCV
ncbi:hypothetical protein AGMMS4952_17020 [Spirochaetia bacterium]|nr:hypothetical protein AGMMS4952_17020 [Spirochaetia bacterium]